MRMRVCAYVRASMRERYPGSYTVSNLLSGIRGGDEIQITCTRSSSGGDDVCKSIAGQEMRVSYSPE